MKLLFVSASAGPHLALDAEYRAIEQSIRAARHRDAFLLIPKLAARLSDLQQALLEHSPDIVHFACHGSDRAELVLLGDHAAPATVPSGALAAMLRVLRDNVTLVVFNACFASAQAEEVRRTVGLAIGMRERVEDSAAIAFSASLYGALAYGRSVGEAFELARAALESASPQSPDLPQLFAGDGIAPHAVHLVGGAGPRPRHRIAIAAAAAAACASIGLAWWLLRPDDPSSDERGVPPPPRPGMARFAGGSIRPGWFAASRRPAECAALRAEEDCAELDPSRQIAEVRIDPFDLDSLEVTNRDYAAWLNAQAEMWQVVKEGILTRQTPPIPLVYTSDECGGGLSLAGTRVHAAADKASRPVVCVTWHGADEYCRAQGKRLPLEMEWELAAKGPQGRPFPWGDALPKHDGVTFDRRESGATHPRDVGTAPQDVSPEGVRDLGGNVAEWVEGRNHLPDGTKTFRGGSWASRGPCHLLGSGCAHRRADLNANDVGFRCASSVIAKRP